MLDTVKHIDIEKEKDDLNLRVKKKYRRPTDWQFIKDAMAMEKQNFVVKMGRVAQIVLQRVLKMYYQIIYFYFQHMLVLVLVFTAGGNYIEYGKDHLNQETWD